MRSWKSYFQNFAGSQSSWLSDLPASAIPSFHKTWASDFQKNPHGWPGGRKDGQSNGRTGRVHWAGRIKSMWCAQTAMWKFLQPHSKTKSTWHNPATCSTQKKQYSKWHELLCASQTCISRSLSRLLCKAALCSNARPGCGCVCQCKKRWGQVASYGKCALQKLNTSIHKQPCKKAWWLIVDQSSKTTLWQPSICRWALWADHLWCVWVLTFFFFLVHQWAAPAAIHPCWSYSSIEWFVLTACLAMWPECQGLVSASDDNGGKLLMEAFVR